MTGTMFSQTFSKRERKKAMSNISIAGNVGSDLTLRYAKSGNAFLTVPVAVTITVTATVTVAVAVTGAGPRYYYWPS